MAWADVPKVEFRIRDRQPCTKCQTVWTSHKSGECPECRKANCRCGEAAVLGKLLCSRCLDKYRRAGTQWGYGFFM